MNIFKERKEERSSRGDGLGDKGAGYVSLSTWVQPPEPTAEGENQFLKVAF